MARSHIVYYNCPKHHLKGPKHHLKWSGRCRARVAQTARNCHRQREKRRAVSSHRRPTCSGVSVRDLSHLPPQIPTCIPTATKIYSPWARASVTGTLLDHSTSCARVSGETSRSQTVPHERNRKLKMKLTSNNFAPQAFVPSYSFAGVVTGTRLKAALTHRSSRPVFSLRAAPT